MAPAAANAGCRAHAPARDAHALLCSRSKCWSIRLTMGVAGEGLVVAGILGSVQSVPIVVVDTP